MTASSGSEQSSWLRLKQQVMDMLQTVIQLPTSAPVTDEVLHTSTLCCIAVTDIKAIKQCHCYNDRLRVLC